jgi:tetratricopeptide (TPR) repeat protein
MRIKRFAAMAAISVTALAATALPALPVDIIGMCQDLLREIETNHGGSHLDLQISTCTAAIETPGFDDGAYAVLYGARGTGYAFKSQYDRAIADYTQSIHLLPTYVPSIYNRGLVKRMTGDSSGAEADFARVRRLRPGYIERIEK